MVSTLVEQEPKLIAATTHWVQTNPENEKSTQLRCGGGEYPETLETRCGGGQYPR